MAVVTEAPRLTMDWCGNRIVDLSREFLNSNGAEKHARAAVKVSPVRPVNGRRDTREGWIAHLSDLNICSQKGLVEMFDSSIGGDTVTMPFGGKYQMTQTQAMAAKLPVLEGETNACSIMGWGYNPYIAEQNPYLGAMYAVVESVAKVVAAGGTHAPCWLTFQEYFERLRNEDHRAGASPWRRCWAAWRPSCSWAAPPSAARTPCPAPSRTSTCRRPWFPSPCPWATPGR